MGKLAVVYHNGVRETFDYDSLYVGSDLLFVERSDNLRWCVPLVGVRRYGDISASEPITVDPNQSLEERQESVPAPASKTGGP